MFLNRTVTSIPEFNLLYLFRECNYDLLIEFSHIVESLAVLYHFALHFDNETSTCTVIPLRLGILIVNFL
jgi:hypothetical protein